MKTIFFYILSLFVTSAFAQAPVFTWNSANTKPAPGPELKLAGNETSGFYVINKLPPSAMEFNPRITIESFDKSLQRIYVRDLAFTSMEDYVDVVYFDNALYLLAAAYDKSAGKNVLTARRISSNGTPDKGVELASIPAEKLSKRGRFLASVSPSSSKLIVLLQPEYTKGENEKAEMIVFGTDFKQQWKGTATLPVEWKKSVNNTPFVNDAGTAFIVKNSEVKGKEQYAIYSYDGKQLKETAIPMEGKREVAEMIHAFAADGSFVSAGYYSEEAKVSVRYGKVLNGNFISTISADGKSDVTAINEEKKNSVVPRYILFSGSNTILAGERFSVTSDPKPIDKSKTPGNQDMFARDYSYSSGTIFFDAFDKAGKLLYSVSKDRSHRSVNDNGLAVTFFAAMRNGKISLLFNDIKNKYDEKKKLISAVIYIPVLFNVDPVNGTISEGSAIDEGPRGWTREYQISPAVFLKLDENRFLIRGENNSYYRMGFMNF